MIPDAKRGPGQGPAPTPSTRHRCPDGISPHFLAVDAAGIIHDLVGDELRPDRETTRCGRILDQHAYSRFNIARVLRQAPHLRPAVHEVAPNFDGGITPRGMCANCARWRAGHEERLVWAVDPLQFDYVRVWTVWSARRQGRPAWNFKTFQLLGWVDLGPGAKTEAGRFVRRIFYLKVHDRRPGPSTGFFDYCAPAEAVDPRTLGPNVDGWKTARAWTRRA